MRKALLMRFLDINNNRNARDFTGETAFMVFPSQFYYFMEFKNVLGAPSTGKMNSTLKEKKKGFCSKVLPI